MIAAYLSFSHNILHRIVDNRLGGLSRRNFQMFRSLCGDTSLRHVIILTTMWDLVSSDVGEAREDELRNKDLFFAGAISKGAKMMRHANQEESAKGVIRAILEDHNEDVTLQIQKELAEGMSIDQTGAGVQLHKDLEALISLHREDMRSLTEDLQNAIKARDEETKKELEDERKRLREEIGRLVDDSRGLAGGYARRVKELEEKMRKAEVTRVQVERRERENLLGRMAEREIGFPGGIMEEHMHTLPSVEAKVQPMVGLWGAMCLMLAPFSLSWKNA
ncbi:hypothetical protein BDQ17DRAFT_1374205 [Cyathus striatus]|nr:hypothetical protein BDQ17DRAFT_1374205 [Cyathus striatus]